MKRTLCTVLVVGALACAVSAAAQQRAAGAQPPAWWKGNLHTHSLWTDGTEFPELIAAWYRDNGYHFVAFTEHDMLQEGERWVDVNAPDAGWPPRNASTRAALPLYRERFGDWVQERRDGDRHLVRLRALSEYRHMYEVRGRFLLLTAEEITDQGGAHVNAFNLAAAIAPAGGPDPAARTRANLAAVEAQRSALQRPILSIVNHPNYVWALTAEEIAAMEHARYFELFSGHMLVNNAGDAQHASTERVWDIVLSLRHAAAQPPLYAVAVDDAHDYRTTADTISRPGRGWVMVRAAALTPEHLLEAMQRADFYASTGVTLRDVQHDAERLRVEIAAEPGVTYRTYFVGTRRSAPLGGRPVHAADGAPLRATLQYGDDVGTVLAVVEGAVAEYAFRGDERYVRARVISSRPHVDPTTGRVLGEQMAWVQPVFR